MRKARMEKDACSCPIASKGIEMSNPTELPDLAEAVRKLVKAKGRFHTEQNYKELADALARYDARRAQPEGEAPQAESTRDKFEAHAKEQGLPLAGHGGHYSNIRTRNRWLGWEAATLPPLCGAQHAESGKERGSIEDYNEFNRLLDLYCDSQADNYAALVAYIDKWADRRAAQLDGGQEGSESNG